MDSLELIPVSSESSTSDPSLYSNEVLSFDDLFEKVSEIQPSDEIVFGDQANPVIGPQGQLLMMDGKIAGLFSSNGQLIAEVTPVSCNPGYEWTPRRAQFLPSGGFLIFGYSRSGYWFNDQGECTGVFPHQPYTRAVVFAPDSSVFAAQLSNPEWHLVKYGPSPDDEEVLLSGPNTQLATRIIAGGLTRSGDGDLFISAFHSPFVYRYRAGKLEKLGYLPSFFDAIPSDLTEAEVNSSNLAMEKVRQAITDHSSTGTVFQLDQDKIMVSFINVDHPSSPPESRLPIALHIMDTDGYPITKGVLFQEDIRPAYTSNGSIYAVEYDERGSADALLNPKIVEYRLKEGF